MPEKKGYFDLRRKAKSYANFGGADSSENPLLQRQAGFYGQMNGGGGIQNIKGPLVSTYIRIQNTDHLNDLVLDLFQANEGAVDAFDGLSDSVGTVATAGRGLIVTVGKERHQVAKNRSIHKPFLIEGLRGQFPSDEQLAQEWDLITSDNNRKLVENYYPNAHLTAGQQQSRQVDHGGFTFLINGDSGFKLLVLKAPSSTVPNIITLTLNVRAITDSAELLRGQSPLALNSGQSLGGADLY